MIKIRFTALLAAAVTVCCLSGCQQNDVSTEQENGVQANVTKSLEINENNFRYITDWSIDNLVQNIEMNGISYSMPFTVEDLGENYTIEENTSSDKGYFLNYRGDEDYALIDIYNDDTDIKKCRIRTITVNDNVDFKIGNLGFGVKREKILEKYGEPSLISSKQIVCTYVFQGETDDKNSVLLFTFNQKGELDGISVGYNKYSEDNDNIKQEVIK